MDEKDKQEETASSSSQGPQPFSLPLPARIVPAGYFTPPAEIKIEVTTTGTKPGTGNRPVSVSVQEVKFIAPAFDLSAVYEILSYIQNIVLERQQKVLEAEKKMLEIEEKILQKGESYHRWDSRVQYYPTLVFIFLEDEETFLTRKEESEVVLQKKTQIKVRLTKYETSIINDSNILQIKTEFRAKDFCVFAF